MPFAFCLAYVVFNHLCIRLLNLASADATLAITNSAPVYLYPSPGSEQLQTAASAHGNMLPVPQGQQIGGAYCRPCNFMHQPLHDSQKSNICPPGVLWASRTVVELLL